MKDEELADVIIERLNGLIGNPDVRRDLGCLLNCRIPCSKATGDHPTIQVGIEDDVERVGFLGVLNGIVGIMPNGEKAGWGYITARFGDDHELVAFERTPN